MIGPSPLAITRRPVAGEKPAIVHHTLNDRTSSSGQSLE